MSTEQEPLANRESVTELLDGMPFGGKYNTESLSRLVTGFIDETGMTVRQAQALSLYLLDGSPHSEKPKLQTLLDIDPSTARSHHQSGQEAEEAGHIRHYMTNEPRPKVVLGHFDTSTRPDGEETAKEDAQRVKVTISQYLNDSQVLEDDEEPFQDIELDEYCVFWTFYDRTGQWTYSHKFTREEVSRHDTPEDVVEAIMDKLDEIGSPLNQKIIQTEVRAALGLDDVEWNEGRILDIPQFA